MNENNSLTCQFKKGDFASSSAKYHYRPNIQLEPIHQKIELSFEINEELCKGSVTQRIKANVVNNTIIELNAINITINNITSVNESTNESFVVTWKYNGSIITVIWERNWQINEIRDLIIDYEVKKPIAGLYYSYPTVNHPDKPIFVGADHETERARYWLPCIDHPSIRTTLEFFLTSDKTHTILANGKLIDEKISGDKKTAHWVLDFPCPSYLLTLCIYNFNDLW